jgi:hypothetical protein
LDRYSNLAHIASAFGSAAFFFGGRQSWQEEPSQNGDDSDYHEEFYECESVRS